tara:strand:+ start:3033 stop:4109 length:1077 start_codon:yes stop_codon:yes gene_type:complete
MAGLTLNNLDKFYGKTQVLFNLSLTIEDGEFIVLVGPSGCGKSTLLRMIAGLEDINKGEILLGEKIINKLAPRDRNVSMVFQNYALYPHLSVAKNISFSLRMRKVEKNVIDQKVKEAAEILGLTNLLTRLPRNLSGGERQRVAMGRAIVREPEVFLFDEPLSNLDAKLRVMMRTKIKEIHHAVKTTTVYVTHDQIEAMTMADKIVVLNEGHIEQVGSPDDLYDKPINSFVASFIGSPSMNLLSGTVVSQKGKKYFQSKNNSLFLLPENSNVKEGQKIIFGFRPEHVDINSSTSEDAITVKVKVDQPTGSQSLVFVNLGEEELCFDVLKSYSLKPGKEFKMNPQLQHIHTFNIETGKRI